MNRAAIVVFIVCLFAAAITIAVILVRAQNLSADARAALDQYIQYRYAPSHPAAIERIARSTLPWNFSAEMSRATFGDSVHYRTTYRYQAQLVMNLPGSPTVTPSLGTVSFSDDRPLVPFPPVDVWCILLREENQSTWQVVYVALHQDLYYADWLLHEAAGDSKKISDALSKIGCDLKSGE